MVHISTSGNATRLYVSGSGEKIETQNPLNFSESKFKGIINSFREGNNFSYSSGNVKFSECDNCVVLSDFNYNYIYKVKNSLVLANNKRAEIIPISNLERCLELSNRHLARRTITYSIPQSVVLREDLIEKDPEKLKTEIISKYALNPIEIKPINGGRTKFGIYHVMIHSGEEFVLKYQGLNPDKARTIAEISNSYPDIFSKVKERTDSREFTFKLEDGLYGLEEFIQGEIDRSRTPQFYIEIGRLIEKLHNKLGWFIQKNPLSFQHLSTESRHLSESNLLAIWLDLTNHHRSYDLETKAIRDLISEDVSKRVQLLPNAVIHGDLNRSNIIWQKREPKIIDKETIKISKRVMELQIPLLFSGPTGFPEYSPKSLEYLAKGLDLGGSPLNEEEFSLMKSLLNYCLIKNYVVRNIRRSLDQTERLKSLNFNLKIIEEELK